MKFQILKKSKKSRARLGILETPHGVVETPAFVPVATWATLKTLDSREITQTKSQVLIANTYHLHIRPGEKVIKKSGGLQKFMSWQGPVMTDSGGFQVFSLGFGKDHGVGKILKEKKSTVVESGQQPKLLKISEDGVFFRSYSDGKELFLGPKESIKIQESLGADIIFAFDECTSPLADYKYTKNSMEKTHRWAKICLNSKKSKQALYGIVQGGKFKDLRIQSAEFLSKMEFDGYGIGGEFGDDKKKMSKMLHWVTDSLPEDNPRHLLGIGHPQDMPVVMKAGVDTFDCIAPTHYARHGSAFTSSGRLDLFKLKFSKDLNPLDKKCGCYVCHDYSRSYINHLLRAREITGLKLLTFHNLYYFNTLAENLRSEIKKGRL